MDEEVEVGEREKKRYTISGRREEETAGGAYRGREGEKRERERGEGGDEGDVCYLEAGTEEKRKSASSLLFCFGMFVEARRRKCSFGGRWRDEALRWREEREEEREAAAVLSERRDKDKRRADVVVVGGRRERRSERRWTRQRH